MPQSNSKWYQDFFHGQPHLNFFVQDTKKDNKNFAVVSVRLPLESLSETYPARYGVWVG